MGTNFYWLPNDEGQLPAGMGTLVDGEHRLLHIGKRSAAGDYCWDCGTPLAKDVVTGPPIGFFTPASNWHPRAVHGPAELRLRACPVCGGTRPEGGNLSDQGHPAGVELGVAKPLSSRPTGVDGASSFSWAQEPARVLTIVSRHPETTIVRDEYDLPYTGAAFLGLILLIPLWFTESIGQSFS